MKISINKIDFWIQPFILKLNIIEYIFVSICHSNHFDIHKFLRNMRIHQYFAYETMYYLPIWEFKWQNFDFLVMLIFSLSSFILRAKSYILLHMLCKWSFWAFYSWFISLISNQYIILAMKSILNLTIYLISFILHHSHLISLFSR
jgi:hypothetical protein